VLGFPVEKESPAVFSRPWITWLLTFVCIAVFACTVTDLQAAANNWGLIPAEKWRYGGLTFLSSMFLHGGFSHIIGNLYFLMIFGDNVEDFFGKRNYALLILLSGLAAGTLHVFFDPGSPIPCVGASGFISGVIAAYAFCFPKVKISFFLRFLWIGIPAWAAFGLWIVFQTVMAYATRSNGGGGVAYMAHIGGAIPGILFALYLRFSTSRKAGDLAKKLDNYSKSY
jgi:membrane associated rhomboid family serine protease